MGNLSKHFSKKEFACPCGCGFDTPTEELLLSLEKLRGEVGDKAITVTSGCRCRKSNKGANDSQHVTGNAADIRVKGLDALQLYGIASKVCTFQGGGIGLYPPGGKNGPNGFVHVDCRGRRARWGRLQNGRYVAVNEAIAQFGESD